MTALRHVVRPGAYHDSIVLMQLRAALEGRPGVRDAGAVMASPENLGLLEAAGLLPELAEAPGPSDLLVVVRARDRDAAEAALAALDELLARDRGGVGDDYRPRSLAAATRLLPAARWVWVSVPGRFAAGPAREALALDRHVFLFSDNVPLEREVALKREAAERGLLVMGPDCGTAIIRGVGFGFANRVRRGPVGIVAASGTGLQAVACRVHALGSGVSHAIGTGGRDTSREVGGVTALQGLDLLGRDPETRVLVLLSKPPSPEVAGRLLAAAERAGKPVVVYFTGGRSPPAGGGGTVRFARGLGDAADLAVRLSGEDGAADGSPGTGSPGEAPSGPQGVAGEPSGPDDAGRGTTRDGYLRGLFAGGTLAHEALFAARAFLPAGTLHSNLEAEGVGALPEGGSSRAHTILDLGADAFTVARPHPMLDNDLRVGRLRREARDPEVSLLLLDVVLGDGTHPDPAADLGPAIEAARAQRHGQPEPEVVVVLVGTDEDPQDLEAQASRLARAGALVFLDLYAALEHVARRLGRTAAAEATRADDGAPTVAAGEAPPGVVVPVDLDVLRAQVAVIDVGLEAFHDSLVEREVRAVHVEWRPPAGGDERLAALLDRMR